MGNLNFAKQHLSLGRKKTIAYKTKSVYGHNIGQGSEFSIYLQVLNYNYIYSLNLFLLVAPWWLCFDWAMGCVPVITSISDVRLLSVVAMWFLVVLFVHRCVKDAQTPYGRYDITTIVCCVNHPKFYS